MHGTRALYFWCMLRVHHIQRAQMEAILKKEKKSKCQPTVLQHFIALPYVTVQRASSLLPAPTPPIVHLGVASSTTAGLPIAFSNTTCKAQNLDTSAPPPHSPLPLYMGKSVLSDE